MALVLMVLAAPHAQSTGIEVAGRCMIRWQPPLWNTDGRPLKDLDHYLIFLSMRPGTYNWNDPTVRVTAPARRVRCPKFLMSQPGQYYLTVVAVDRAGRWSEPSAEVPFVVKTR